MSMLERDLQDVNLASADEADEDAAETENELEREDIEEEETVVGDEEAFEKALNREDRHQRHSLDATQIYLNEIGFSPLLTPEEEVLYGRLARQGDPAGRARMI